MSNGANQCKQSN